MRLAVVCLAIAATVPAHADERVWIGSVYEEGAGLIYGLPESGDVALSFSCMKGSDSVVFSYAFEPVNPVDGVEVEVTLQAGDIILPIQTVGLRLEMDDLFVLEGETKFDAGFMDLVTSSGLLEVFVEDGSEEIPLDGAREAALDLSGACVMKP